MAGTLIKELGVEDLYGFLGVSSTASDNEIKKGYRKKALRYHPDKNPDNTSAAEMFQKLSRIYGVLTDPPAKAAYDKWLKARELVKRRNEELSAKRRKLKQCKLMKKGYVSISKASFSCVALESKENEHYATLQAEQEAMQMMKSQIERLREQSSEMVRQQQELLRSSLLGDDSDIDKRADDVIIQATWDAGSGDFTVEQITDMFSKYGQVGVVKKKKKALISFTRPHDAVLAIKELSDTFKFKWISGEPPVLIPTAPEDVLRMGQKKIPDFAEGSDSYEKQVLERMHKAQERKAQEEATAKGPINEKHDICDTEYEKTVLERLHLAQEKKDLSN